MNGQPIASIIINNYNYDRFLADAIDSAPSQPHSHTEVIVVDDSFTTNSQNVISGYDDRIVATLQENR